MKISVKEVGVGSEVNPYEMDKYPHDHDYFKRSNPPLPALDTNGNPLPVGEYEVELVWQHRPKGENRWYRASCSKESIGKEYDTRQVYIESVAPESKEVKELEFEKTDEGEVIGYISYRDGDLHIDPVTDEKEVDTIEREWIAVDPDLDIYTETNLQHFEQYFIVMAENGKVNQALFCDWDTEGIDNTWIINDVEYPLSFATHYMPVIYPNPPKQLIKPQ